MKIGLIGYGGVGKAFIRLLKEKNIDCKVIFVLKSDGGIFDKSGLDINEIIENETNIKKHKNWIEKLKLNDVIDEKLDFLIELTPTNKVDGEPAITYIKEALSRKINVVTGNKGPILADYHGLKNLADKNKVTIGIGCTTGGALPSINGGIIECAGSEILSIEGVLNGTTNFILKEMLDRKISYEEALLEAQRLGIAENDPSFDVEGYDTAIKMIILTNAIMNVNFKLSDVKIEGVTKLKYEDLRLAHENNQKIKLVGKAFRENDDIRIEVAPRILEQENPLYFVDGREKGIVYYTDVLGRILISGGASGVKNAAASILRDLVNINLRVMN